MGRLLLRSTRTPQKPTQVDVYFQNVHAIKLGTKIEGLNISTTTTEAQRAIETEIGPMPSSTRAYLVETTTFTGFVIASVMTFDEGDHHYDDISPLWGEV